MLENIKITIYVTIMILFSESIVSGVLVHGGTVTVTASGF